MSKDKTPNHIPPAIVMKPDQQRPWWQVLPIRRGKPSLHNNLVKDPNEPILNWGRELNLHNLAVDNNTQVLYRQTPKPYEPVVPITQPTHSRRSVLRGIGILAGGLGPLAVVVGVDELGGLLANHPDAKPQVMKFHVGNVPIEIDIKPDSPPRVTPHGKMHKSRKP
ncbi:MAG TPA: hypothetical protein VGT05_03280 [Patescibacteria group bacterium]|nr:hypothetical protein [Patescibacteria group bacterium]